MEVYTCITLGSVYITLNRVTTGENENSNSLQCQHLVEMCIWQCISIILNK